MRERKKKKMKNLYLVNNNGNVTEFTTKKAALSFVKKLEKSGNDPVLSILPKYSNGYIEMMKWQYMLYKKSNITEMRKAYNNPSYKKISSYERIKNSVLPGTAKILSANCHFYTTGSLTENPLTGEIMFRYDTCNNVREIPLSLID